MGDIVGVIGEPGESVDVGEAPATTAPPPASSDTTPEPVSAPAAMAEAPAPGPAPAAATPRAGADGRVKASPLARRLASERGLDLSTVQGTGPGGRIIKRDIEHAAVPAAIGGTEPPFHDLPLTQIRKTIAKRLVQSIGPIPTFYLTTEVDMERVVEARGPLKDAGYKISFNDIILKAVALALRKHPMCNAWWQGDHIRLWNDVHIGVAVAIDDGLITPVVRHADRKPLAAIADEIRELAGRARERKLLPEEYTGATFSVSNLGNFGIDEFTAVINPPEAGILAVGRIVPKQVVHGSDVVVRRRMRVTMSCDHRVIDGATGAQYLQTLTEMLENPLAMLL